MVNAVTTPACPISTAEGSDWLIGGAAPATEEANAARSGERRCEPRLAYSFVRPGIR